MQQLSEVVTFTKVADHSASAGAEVDSASVDTAGYEGVVFLTSLSVANVGNYLAAQQSSDDGVADGWSDIEGSKVSSGASDEDLWLDIHPTKRYVRAVVIRAGAATTCESIWALRYGGPVAPVSNVLAGTIAGEAHFAAAEGTA